ncbi:hypothetical protein SCHPADRAFT_946332 [Schizopora paradoxa]|uniref:Uncharacterized protein n=1 Tax=Schizopora paradoxa TaxID=27342 RepID=A0A0H2RMU8_9AGAM|nr:hypothetical protein SCHPADRAFT_946332 [Schizopora paradoxa]
MLLHSIASFMSSVLFLSGISLYIGLPAITGPSIGILAKALLRDATRPEQLPSSSAVLDVQCRMTSLARRSLNISEVAADEVASLAVAIDDIASLVERIIPDFDEEADVLDVLLEMRRSSLKVHIGLMELSSALHGSSHNLFNTIELRNSLWTHACALPFISRHPPSSSHEPSYDQIIVALSNQCLDAVNILDSVHTELVKLIDDVWPRLDLQLILLDKLIDDDATHRSLANLATVVRQFFIFSTFVEYKTATFYLALSHAHEAVEDLLGLTDA